MVLGIRQSFHRQASYLILKSFNFFLIREGEWQTCTHWCQIARPYTPKARNLCLSAVNFVWNIWPNRDLLAVIPLQNSHSPLSLLNIIMVHFREDVNLVCIHFGAFGYMMCLSLVLKLVVSPAVIVKVITDPDRRKYKKLQWRAIQCIH